MSILKFTTLLFAGVMLAGLAAATAMSQDAPPPREAANGWDRGPAPGEAPTPPGTPPGPQPAPRADGPAPAPGPQGPGGPQPPNGPDGARMQPPGPPMDFEGLKTRDPDLYKAIQEDRELEQQTHEQAEQYRRAGKDEQAKIKEKLGELVDKHFAVRQQLRTLEVKRLEQQVKELREKIEQREKNRKELIGKRINELTGEDEGEHF